ncbi:MAG: phosphatase PAP2 family protein [Bdellovibrionota bacterium]
MKKIKTVLLSVDHNGLLWATEFRHPYVNNLMKVFTRLGDWDTWTAFFVASLLRRGNSRYLGLRVLPRVLGALAVAYTLKRLARRERPSVAVEGFSTLVTDPDPYSFPSSHAATTWAGCITLARQLGGVAWLLPCHAVLVSYSRIHLGCHYPVDVVTGAMVGVAVASV